MNLTELVYGLEHRGVTFIAVSDRLRIRAPANTVTPALREQLTIHKAAILTLLRERREYTTCVYGNGTAVSSEFGAGFVDAPHELSLAERVESGYVNPGWTPRAWAARLRQLADRCEADHPDKATEYRQWVARIEGKMHEKAR